jgi:hypothetical protein
MNKIITSEHKKAAIAFTLIFGLAFLLTSCNPTRASSAGCKNGYVGYGTPFTKAHGPKRTTY